MLNVAKGRQLREGPLAEINNSTELDAWLLKQPRAVAVAFAARAALRVLPIVWEARGRGFKGDFFAGNVLPVFRATGVAWAAAKYPAQARKFDAYAAAYAATAAAAAAAAAHVFAAHAFAAHVAAATRAARAAARAADAATSAADAARAFWSAVSIDATRVEEGAAASDIAGSPLWPQGRPDLLRSLWQEMKETLHAAKQDWQVWTIWYDDRLEGRLNDETRDLAYVRIEEALWNQGPAIVNAEIKRRIEERPPPRVVEVSASAWPVAQAAPR